MRPIGAMLRICNYPNSKIAQIAMGLIKRLWAAFTAILVLQLRKI